MSAVIIIVLITVCHPHVYCPQRYYPNEKGIEILLFCIKLLIYCLILQQSNLPLFLLLSPLWCYIQPLDNAD